MIPTSTPAMASGAAPGTITSSSGKPAGSGARAARFVAAGYPAPAFKDVGGGQRAALAPDPAGFLVLVLAELARIIA